MANAWMTIVTLVITVFSTMALTRHRPVLTKLPKDRCVEGECEFITLTCEYPEADEVESITLSKQDRNNHLEFIELSAVSVDDPYNPVDTCEVGDAKSDGDIGKTRGSAWLSLTWQEPTRAVSGKYECVVLVTEPCGETKEEIVRLLVMVHKGNPHTVSAKVQQEQTSQIEKLTQEEEVLEQKIEKLEEELDEMKETQDNPVAAPGTNTLGGAVVESLVIESDRTVDGHTFVLSYFLMAGNEKSADICRSMKGYLAEMDDEEEYRFVKHFLKMHMTPSQVVLIGGSDQKTENDWIFPRTNQKAPILDWVEGQPAGYYGENCLSLVMNAMTRDIKMNDWPCDSIRAIGKPWHYAFLCEIPHNDGGQDAGNDSEERNNAFINALMHKSGVTGVKDDTSTKDVSNSNPATSEDGGGLEDGSDGMMGDSPDVGMMQEDTSDDSGPMGTMDDDMTEDGDAMMGMGNNLG